MRQTEIRHIHVKKLRLDDTNPRLPERLHGRTQSEIVTYLHARSVLERIAQSYLENGFFADEPLIVTRETKRGQQTIVEGNRRLATLAVLHRLPIAKGRHFIGIHATREQLEELTDIPCILSHLSHDREKRHAYLGFKHIWALETWPLEAQARHILTEVERTASQGSEHPLRDVAQRIGSPTQSVRNLYLSIRVLNHAKEIKEIKEITDSDRLDIQEDGFALWHRCIGSADVREYIGLTRIWMYRDIEEALKKIDADKLREIILDLRDGRKLSGPNDIATYGKVLKHPSARKTLRKTRDLNVAKQIADEPDAERRVGGLVADMEKLIDSLHRLEDAEITRPLDEATRTLKRLARSASAIVEDRIANRKAESPAIPHSTPRNRP